MATKTILGLAAVVAMTFIPANDVSAHNYGWGGGGRGLSIQIGGGGFGGYPSVVLVGSAATAVGSATRLCKPPLSTDPYIIVRLCKFIEHRKSSWHLFAVDMAVRAVTADTAGNTSPSYREEHGVTRFRVALFLRWQEFRAR